MSEAETGRVDGPDWKAWGEPRLGERGVETAFHHPLILLRARGGEAVRVLSPGDVVGDLTSALEWSPMPWALRGRRLWRSPGAPGPGAVFRTSDDRLYLSSDSAGEQLFEGDCLRRRSLDGWLETLKARNDYFDARGIAYRLLVVPEGHAISSESIAGAPKLSPDRPMMQILREADERTRQRMVYPLDALIAGRAKAETSYPHDVHLTGYGYLLVYRAWLSGLPGVDPARLLRDEEMAARKQFVAGDLARSLGLPGRRVDMLDAPWPPHRALLKGSSYRTYQVDVFETDETHLPRLVLFRTSNCSHLFPHLLRHFSRIAAMASVSVHYDLIESEKPDVVLVEMPERYFAHVEVSVSETDLGGPPRDAMDEFEMRTGHTLPLPRGAAT